jgi:hypothetical protein
MSNKIKIYIVTYKNPQHLQLNLDSIFSSNVNKEIIEVHVINNHSEIFSIPSEYEVNVKVHHQTTRANWGCGHIARDWNQALVQGIENLKKPSCSQIILCQDDTIWNKDWYQKLSKIHTKYNFYTCGWGDNFMSFLPDAVSNIGLFDERFCAIGYQEGDYFLRAWMYNRDKSSINDGHHGRVINPCEDVAHRADNLMQTRNGAPYQPHNKSFWWHKWPDVRPEQWKKGLFRTKSIKCNIPNYMYYPYFEYDIQDLEKKGYLVNQDYISKS